MHSPARALRRRLTDEPVRRRNLVGCGYTVSVALTFFYRGRFIVGSRTLKACRQAGRGRRPGSAQFVFVRVVIGLPQQADAQRWNGGHIGAADHAIVNKRVTKDA